MKRISNFILFLIIIYSLNISKLFGLDFIPYQGTTKKIVTEHFVILFPKKYSSQANKVANYAEDIHTRLSSEMQWKPFRRTVIILTDHTDMPNGSALPFIRNTITLYMSPIDLENSLRNTQDTLYLLIVHEYAHILHLDQIRGGAWFWRVLYGKLYHPHVNTFMWYIEGMATFRESNDFPGGRLGSSYNNAIIRIAAKNHKIPSYNKLIYPVVDWPNNEAVYHYGAKFVEYIYNTYGKEKFDAFIKDLSDDFWPFICLFVMKFKKHYGKSLDTLWNEWILYEEKLASQIPEVEIKSNMITNLNGNIISIDYNNNSIFFSSESYKKDQYLYKLNPDGKLEKIHYGYHRSVSASNNENYILYTSPVDYPDETYYSDLFSLNLKTKTQKQLTFRKRINYISFATNSPTGVLVSHTGEGSKLFISKFIDNKLIDTEELKLPEDIIFVDQPDINVNGDKAVFAARIKTGKFRIFLLDINTKQIKLFDDKIVAKNTKWIDDDNISFVAPDGYTDSLYGISISTKKIYRFIKSYGRILNGFIKDNKVYYIDYTLNGYELFSTEKDEKENKIDISSSQVENEIFDYESAIKNDYLIKTYTGFEYFLPTVWAFLPYKLQSNAYFVSPIGKFFSLPFIGPQFMVYNSLPLGRFSYLITVGFDYLKLYPDNSLALDFKLPFISLSYYWENWKGGYKHFVINQYEVLNYNGKYPINFFNSLTLYNDYSLADCGNFYWELSFNHQFQEYNFYQQKLTNSIYFYETISYYYIIPRIKTSRWDRGILLSLSAIQEPAGILDNYPVYLLRGSIKGRAPFYNSFFFANIEGGTELLNQNVFECYSDMFKLNFSILSVNNSNSIQQIDTKAFLSYLYQSSIGSSFISIDAGFDITLYKKSVYWYFATIGFKELYMKPYAEFVYLHNFNNYPDYSKGIMFDIVDELGIDLFVAYGNITVSLLLGLTLGYRVGDTYPVGGAYLYCNFGL